MKLLITPSQVLTIYHLLTVSEQVFDCKKKIMNNILTGQEAGWIKRGAFISFHWPLKVPPQKHQKFSSIFFFFHKVNISVSSKLPCSFLCLSQSCTLWIWVTLWYKIYSSRLLPFSQVTHNQICLPTHLHSAFSACYTFCSPIKTKYVS